MPMHRRFRRRPPRAMRAMAMGAATWVALALGWLASAHAQDAERISGAVMGLNAKVPGDARTAPTLGTDRTGTGVVIDSTGLVLTIGYLILEASEVTLVDAGGVKTPAEIVGYDHRTGFGLVKALNPVGKPLALGNSAQLKERDTALIVGRDGQEHVSIAQVIARKEFAGSWEYLLENAIFTAPAHPRHSGAALISAEGELLGIGSLFLPQQVPGVGIVPGNMFVPVDALKPILADLIAEGRPAKGSQAWLGLAPEEVRGHLFVERVSPGGPAEAAGIKPGDLIVGVAGERPADMAAFFKRVWALGPPGTEVPLDIVQGSTPRRVVVKSADRYAWLKLKRSY